MRRSLDRLSDRTLPLSFLAERAAGARGGTSPPSGRNLHGRPEPPPGARQVRGDPPGSGCPQGVRTRAFFRGNPPGLGQGPPGSFLVPGEVWRGSHGPPRQVRGDSEPLAQAPSTCGILSGSNLMARTSRQADSSTLLVATGPPGEKTAGSAHFWPPPGSESLGRAPPGRWRARGSPPVRGSPRRRGPPGASDSSHSSLSAGRWRERIPCARTETERHAAARKPKPKSRKITSWL